MRVILDLSGTELALLYITTGNKSAGDLIRKAIGDEKKFMSRIEKLPSPKK